MARLRICLCLALMIAVSGVTSRRSSNHHDDDSSHDDSSHHDDNSSHESHHVDTINIASKLARMFEFLVKLCRDKVQDLKFTRIAGGYYYIHKGPMVYNWFEAKDWCAQRGMVLANLETQAERKAINAKLSALVGDASFLDVGFPFFWIGGNDQGVEGSYKWLNGESIVGANWFPTEPDGANTQNCILLLRSSAQFAWSDAACSTLRFKFICELPNPCNDIFHMVDSLTGDSHSSSADTSEASESFQHGI